MTENGRMEKGIVGPAQLLDGLTFEGLPLGWKPMAATLLVKCLDENGDAVWSFRTSEEHVSDEELLGVLSLRIHQLRTRLLEEYD